LLKIKIVDYLCTDIIQSVRILNGLLLLEATSHIIFYENMSYLRPNAELL